MRPLILFLLALWPAMAAADPLRVVAVNSVLADFARTLGGDRVAVEMPVPPGRDPALWQPTIEEIGAIQQADLIILSGAGYADWTARVSLPRARTVVAAGDLGDRLIETEDAVTHSHGPEGEHIHAGTASHVWLDFSLAAAQAEAIAAALDGRLEGGVEAGPLLDALAALHARAEEIGATMEGPVIASHPRYQYFARAYGVDVLSLDWDPGTAPSDTDLAELDALLAETQATLFLWERAPVEEGRIALAERNLSAIVFETGANDDMPFLDRMSRNLDALAQALGG